MKKLPIHRPTIKSMLIMSNANTTGSLRTRLRENGYLLRCVCDLQRVTNLHSASSQGYEILRELFPNWATLSTENEVCAVCEAMVQISREDKRGAKIQAEDEKVSRMSVLRASPAHTVAHRRLNSNICTTTH